MNDIVHLKKFKNSTCVCCRSYFYVKDSTFKNSRCPLLLYCGHSICESCLNQTLKTSRSIVCHQCKQCSSPGTVNSVYECFPPNAYIVGKLMIANSRKYGRDRKFHDKTEKILSYELKKQKNSNFKFGSINIVCEECSNTALWYCDNCKSNFCDMCWLKVHSSAKSLLKHKKTSVKEIQTEKLVVYKKCEEHAPLNLELYCKNCSVTVCSHCVIQKHQGEEHCLVTLKDKNVHILKDVSSAAKNAYKMNRKLKQAIEKIELNGSAPDALNYRTLSELGNQISRNFARLHGFLQMEEDRILKELKNNFSEREDFVKDLTSRIEKQIEDIDNLLHAYEFVMQNPENADLSDLRKQLTEVQNTPCHLVPINLDKRRVKLDFNDDLINMIKQYCKMQLPAKEFYELYPTSNLPENYTIEPVSESESEAEAETEAKSKGKRKKKDKEALQAVSELPQAIVFSEAKNYSVRLAYIKNPGEFYVSVYAQRVRLQALEKAAEEFASNSTSVPKPLARDEVYLIQYIMDKKWCRVRIVEFLPNKKIKGVECVRVNYIDYGNTDIVAVSRLRHIPPSLVEEPPLVVRCKLFESIPKNEVEWCAESTKTMEKILADYTAIMYVMKVNPDCLEVDLSVRYPDSPSGREIVSIRDALMFLDYSTFVRSYQIPRSVSALTYLNQCIPAKGEVIDCIITHVNSPSDFYLQNKEQDLVYLNDLSDELEKYYESCPNKNFVYNPTEGMPCVARFSEDNKWYRAKIIDIPVQKMVTVFYVDYGNKETIPWDCIRKLRDEFFKRPPTALHCSLAGVVPVDVSWNSKATAYMKDLVLSEYTRVQICSKPKHFKQRLKVILFNQENEIDVCVNSVFIDLGYAKKSIPHLQFPNEEEEKVVVETSTVEVVSETDKKEEEEVIDIDNYIENTLKNETFEGYRRPKLNAKELIERYELEKSRNPQKVEEEKEESDINEHDNIFKMRIKVLTVKSPSCVYFTFPALLRDFENFQKKLIELYQYSEPSENVNWKEGSECAVYDYSTCSWYRGCVLACLPNDFVKVFLKDVGDAITCPVSFLRKLDPSFSVYPACAIKCHLIDIKPPAEEWPSVSCEFLDREIFKHRNVYLTKRVLEYPTRISQSTKFLTPCPTCCMPIVGAIVKKGAIENHSVPVELWVQNVFAKGALDPLIREWVTVNRLLVLEGLAIPMKPKLWNTDTSVSKNPERENSLKKIVEEVSDVKIPLFYQPFVPSVDCQWKPPRPLTRSCFIGMVTYIDNDATMHVYDAEREEDDLFLIRESLENDFSDSEPDLGHSWSEGQMCTVKYHVDKMWYRGQILKVNENSTYDVLFVDYGNVETCEVDELRIKVNMSHIPILSHRIKLQGIHSVSEDGKWPASVIDAIHSLIVEKQCDINILQAPSDPSDIYIADITISDNHVDAGLYLVSRGLATLGHGNFSKFPKLTSFPTSHVSFHSSSFSFGFDMRKLKAPSLSPTDWSEFFIQVTYLTPCFEFFGYIVYSDFLPCSVKSVFRKFEILERKLKDECPLLPRLMDFIKGQSCSAICSKNHKWGRAEIESWSECGNSVSVFFIDYGEKELVQKDLVHECKEEWMKIPKMALKCKLANYEKSPDVSDSEYTEVFSACLKKAPVFVDVVQKLEEIVRVELRTKRDGDLVYQDMIDKKLMVRTTERTAEVPYEFLCFDYIDSTARPSSLRSILM